MKRKVFSAWMMMLIVCLLQGNPPHNFPVEVSTVTGQEPLSSNISTFPPIPSLPIAVSNPILDVMVDDVNRSTDTTTQPLTTPTPSEPVSDAPPSLVPPEGAITRNETLKERTESTVQGHEYMSKEKGLKVPILMYHNVLEGDVKGDGLNVSEKALEDQLATLKAYGYHTITFDELYQHYNENANLPENPVIITFDDGYKSNYTLAYPLLKKYDMKACIFMITNAIGSKNFMTKSELQELSDSGLIEIQSHSVSHDYQLASMSSTAMAQELYNSKNILEEITGKPITVFCYPYGRTSKKLIQEVKNQGYLLSVTTQYGCASKKSNPLTLPRIRVSGEDTGIALKKKIEALTGRITKPQPTSEPTPLPEASPLLPLETPVPPEVTPAPPEGTSDPSEEIQVTPEDIPVLPEQSPSPSDGTPIMPEGLPAPPEGTSESPHRSEDTSALPETSPPQSIEFSVWERPFS